MQLIHLRPEQLQDAVRRNVACLIPAGCTEYHGPHLPIGTEEGEVDFDPEAFFAYSREVLRRIAAMGFGRIYILQHHQGPDGLEVLCLKRAAGEVLRETVHRWGPGWGRTDDHEALQSLTQVPRWLEDADAASAESGRRWIEFCVEGWVRELERGVEPA